MEFKKRLFYRNRNRNKFINQIRVPGGHIQITIMIDAQQQYIKLNFRGEISIIVKNKFFYDYSKTNQKCPQVRKT